MNWLCYLGFHKKKWAEDKITEITSNHTLYCEKCGIIIKELGTTTFSMKVELGKDG